MASRSATAFLRFLWTATAAFHFALLMVEAACLWFEQTPITIACFLFVLVLFLCWFTAALVAWRIE